MFNENERRYFPPYVILIINVRSTVSLTVLFNEVHTDETSMVKCFYISLHYYRTLLLAHVHSIHVYISIFLLLFFLSISFLISHGFLLATLLRQFSAHSNLYSLVGRSFFEPNIYLINWHLFSQ